MTRGEHQVGRDQRAGAHPAVVPLYGEHAHDALVIGIELPVLYRLKGPGDVHVRLRLGAAASGDREQQRERQSADPRALSARPNVDNRGKPGRHQIANVTTPAEVSWDGFIE